MINQPSQTTASVDEQQRQEQMVIQAVQQAMSGYMTSVNNEAADLLKQQLVYRSAQEQNMISSFADYGRHMPQQTRSNSLPGIPNDYLISLQNEIKRRQSLAVNQQGPMLNPEDMHLFNENLVPNIAHKLVNYYNLEAQSASTYISMSQTQKCAVLIDTVLMMSDFKNQHQYPESLEIMSQETTPSMATAAIQNKSAQRLSQFAPSSSHVQFEVKLKSKASRHYGRIAKASQNMKESRAGKPQGGNAMLTSACNKQVNKVKALTRNDSNQSFPFVVTNYTPATPGFSHAASPQINQPVDCNCSSSLHAFLGDYQFENKQDEECHASNLSASLYFYVLCKSLKLPDSFSPIILTIIQRFVGKLASECNEHGGSREQRNAIQDFMLNEKDIINQRTIKRLILTAVLLTQKFYSDFFYSNNYIARLGDLTTLQEMNRCEQVLLDTIDYNINVDVAELVESINVLNCAFDNLFHASDIQQSIARLAVEMTQLDQEQERHEEMINQQRQQMQQRQQLQMLCEQYARNLAEQAMYREQMAPTLGPIVPCAQQMDPHRQLLQQLQRQTVQQQQDTGRQQQKNEVIRLMLELKRSIDQTHHESQANVSDLRPRQQYQQYSSEQHRYYPAQPRM